MAVQHRLPGVKPRLPHLLLHQQVQVLAPLRSLQLFVRLPPPPPPPRQQQVPALELELEQLHPPQESEPEPPHRLLLHELPLQA